MLTGQHPQLDPAEHGFHAEQVTQLDCPGLKDPHAHVGQVSRRLLPYLYREPPEMLVVQGDTSSALGGALAASMAGIPLAHVEAGLRSHDLRRPWPEEEFRVAIDAESDLLFAPTELSAANLRREGVAGEIHVTGNSGVDALLAVGGSAPEENGGEQRILVTCHRRENWNEGLVRIAAALRRIAEENIARVEVIRHPNPDLAQRLRALLPGSSGIAFRQPCTHVETVAAMTRSHLVLSDSGGMQEEAASLGVPMLVLRERTERPEAIASAAIELVGTDTDAITAAVRRTLAAERPAGRSLCYGDGSAGERIAAILFDWLTRRSAGGQEAGGGAATLFPKASRRANA